jgi:membrane protein DedA with SNARE-associated domain
MDPVEPFVAALAAYGVVGLVAIAFAERFIPLIPSSAVLATIGAAAAQGLWQPWVAVAATALGGTFGCIIGFLAVRAFGVAHAKRLLRSAIGARGGLAGWIDSASENSVGLAFSVQLLPMTRTLAPALAILPGRRQLSLHLASFVGITIWNTMFIGAGYVASLTTETENTTSVVLWVFLSLIVVQATTACLLRRLQSYGRISTH